MSNGKTTLNDGFQRNVQIIKIMPVLFGFFVMGFVDIIGIVINYVKIDLSLSDSMVNLISLSCFFWFLIISIPTGMLMNRIGRKNTVLISFLFTIVGLMIPVINYDFIFILIAFALIGIGNAIIQVSLNPLVTNVVSSNRLTGVLTLGQFVKAISSCIGPIAVSLLASSVLGWKYIFPVYSIVSLFATMWLWTTRIKEVGVRDSNEVSFAVYSSLMKNKKVLFFFTGILVLVGIDVGLNTTLPKYLMEKCNLELEQAILGNSVYFFARTIGALLGGIFLLKYSERNFFKYSVIVCFIGLICMLFFHSLWSLIVCVIVFGLGYANLFAIIFSLSLRLFPEKANEISSLLIVGVSGGAIITPILGVFSDLFKSQTAAIAILSIIWVYLIWLKKHLNSAK